MSLATARTAIVNKITNDIPSLITCAPHAGRFDLGELKRIAAKSPAVLVSALSVRDIQRKADYAEGLVLWAVYIVTKDSPQCSRDLAALAYVDALGRLLPDERWDLEPSLGIPLNIDANNLFSTALDSQGVAMWSVTWSQRMSLGAAMPVASMDDFLSYYAEHNISDDADVPVSSDQITYA